MKINGGSSSSTQNTPKKREVVEVGETSGEDTVEQGDINEGLGRDEELEVTGSMHEDDELTEILCEPIPRKRGRPRKNAVKGVARHRLSKTKRYRCKECSAGFSIPSRLKEHARIHTGERPYSCEKCEMRFMRATHLRKHRMLHTGLRPFECEDCGKTFTNNASLKEHSYTHSGERPHKCPHCSRSFARKISLKEHLRKHTGETPYGCKECSEKFAKKAQLKAHMLYHTGEKPYLCQTCGARFRHNTAFNEHVRIHTGIKPFVCQHCGTAFTCRSTLKKHIRLHTGEKPYSCTVCGMGFAQRTSLVCHIKKHPGLTLPTRNAAKHNPKGSKSEVCLFPIVGRKRRTNNQRQQPTDQSAQSDTVTMVTSMTSSDSEANQEVVLNTGLSNGVEDSLSGPLVGGAKNCIISSASLVSATASCNHSQNGHAHGLADHAHFTTPHLPMPTIGWSHNQPTQVPPTFTYDQSGLHRGVHHPQAAQQFGGFLPMSAATSQMAPAFPDQQRFPLDYRFSLN